MTESNPRHESATHVVRKLSGLLLINSQIMARGERRWTMLQRAQVEAAEVNWTADCTLSARCVDGPLLISTLFNVDFACRKTKINERSVIAVVLERSIIAVVIERSTIAVVIERSMIAI